MRLITSIFGWVFRQGILFVLILAALAFHQFIWPMLSDGAAKNAVTSEWKSPGEIATELKQLQRQKIADIKQAEADILSLKGAAISRRLDDAKAQLIDVDGDLGQGAGLFASVRPTAIIAREQLKLRKQSLLAEIRLIKAVAGKEQSRLSLADINYPSAEAVRVAQYGCDAAKQAIKEFNDSSYLSRVASIPAGRAAALTTSAKDKCDLYTQKKKQRDTGLQASKLARTQYDKSTAALAKVQDQLTDGLRQYAPDAVAQRTFKSLLLQALLILILLISMPLIIRTLFYYVLAPLAERRATIKISVPGDHDVPIPPSLQSRISIPVTLGPLEQLLVRQDYLQTSSLAGTKDTRWLLDYWHPLSSIASGLFFLTRITGEGEMTTISAVRDPFAELTEVTLPLGAACILHPHALVAVVQADGQTGSQPMRITSHWRLFSLNAWLTLQLRYLVFHGPCRLIVKGGRGIRVERAERGRIFGQDQLVGFSADLAYSVTRTETFAPYLFGREQLFKDKIEQGTGIVIIEEAPLSSRSGSSVRRGLEGMFDAGLKAFGV